MDQTAEPIATKEEVLSDALPSEAVETAMDVTTGEEPKKVRLTKAEKRALAESKRKEQWKAKVRIITSSTSHSVD